MNALATKQLRGWAAFGLILAIPLTIIIALAIGLLWAKVLSDLWRWFIVPAFGVRAMPFRAAYGLFLMGMVWTHGLKRAGVKDNESAIMKVTAPITSNLFAALITWGMGAAASELLR